MQDLKERETEKDHEYAGKIEAHEDISKLVLNTSKTLHLTNEGDNDDEDELKPADNALINSPPGNVFPKDTFIP